jgi:erythromycin esterase-like protein
LAGSHEALLHAVGSRFLVAMEHAGHLFDEPRLERAIGVIYRPDTERQSHWFHARLSQQFDAIVHVDDTTAVEPLERNALWDAGEPPETYPTGL